MLRLILPPDPLDSMSRILDGRYIGQERYDVAREVRGSLPRITEGKCDQLPEKKSKELERS